jgi:hypothetical protein
VLRAKNGSDFYPVDFDKLYKENGIERHNTNPYTPQ